jgi:two-component sensor histidine kinase
MTMTDFATHAAPMMVLPPLADPSSADEINHRIANSLQLISAMISIEARAIVDPVAQVALDRTRQRIGAIAGVHRQLYQAGETGAVDLAVYLRDLGRDLEQGCADSDAGRQILVEAAPVVVAPEEATSIGIIVSELVGNACKYAYAPGQAGDVRIRLAAAAGGGYRLEVEDDGRGMVPGQAPQGSGLGGRLIEMMAARLGGRPDWDEAHAGTRFVMRVHAPAGSSGQSAAFNAAR